MRPQWRHGGLRMWVGKPCVESRRVVRAVSPGSAGAFVSGRPHSGNRACPDVPIPMDPGTGQPEGARSGSRGSIARREFKI
jgi:hypothetical protein